MIIVYNDTGGVGSPRSYGTQHDNYPPNSPLAYGPQDGLTYYDAMARQRQQQSMPNNGTKFETRKI